MDTHIYIHSHTHANTLTQTHIYRDAKKFGILENYFSNNSFWLDLGFKTVRERKGHDDKSH